jgi:hypothetical protein
MQSHCWLRGRKYENQCAITHRNPHPHFLLSILILLVSPFVFAFPQEQPANLPSPLTFEDVTVLLKGEVSPRRVATLVRQRGVVFALSDDIQVKLRAAGADDDLILAIAAAQKFYVRPAYQTMGAEVWSDPSTDLTWTKKDSNEDVIASGATLVCNGLSIAEFVPGASGPPRRQWRVPTIFELAQIYDPAENSNGIHVKGGIRLSGRIWSDGECRKAVENGLILNGMVDFDFQRGKRGCVTDLSKASGQRALCVSGDRNPNEDKLQGQLSSAAGDGKTDVVAQLLRLGADVNAAPPHRPSSLVNAIAGRRVEVVRFLLAQGADPNLRDPLGDTPLMTAVTLGGNEIVRLLLSNNANVNGNEILGDTPLICATMQQQPDLKVITTLLESGAAVNARGVSQYTALMRASSNGNVEVVRLLIAHGADVSYKGGSIIPLSALQMAKREKHNDVVQVLRKAGAHD